MEQQAVTAGFPHNMWRERREEERAFGHVKTPALVYSIQGSDFVLKSFVHLPCIQHHVQGVLKMVSISGQPLVDYDAGCTEDKCCCLCGEGCAQSCNVKIY